MLLRFDPIEYARQLRQNGFSQEQADIQAQAMIHLKEEIIADAKQELDGRELVNKTDLLLTKTELLTEMEVIRKEIEVLRKEIVIVRYDSLKFVIWTGVSVIVVLGGMSVKGFHWV